MSQSSNNTGSYFKYTKEQSRLSQLGPFYLTKFDYWTDPWDSYLSELRFQLERLL